MNISLNRKILFAFSILFITYGASANCYRITGTNSNVNNVRYTDPNAIVGAWSGAGDRTGSMGTVPKVININNNEFQPLTSLIASGTVSFLQSGSAPYSPEQILFRCTSDLENDLWEYYSTNGDSSYAGAYEAKTPGLESGTYITPVNGVGMRVTNSITGNVYGRIWQARALTGLDKDSQGWILVKAKNFSDFQVELIKIDYPDNRNVPTLRSGLSVYSQPNVYIAFKGGGMSSALFIGADHANNYSGFSSEWPGAVNMYNNTFVTRAATCMMKNVTPNVRFPTMSITALANNEVVTAPIVVNFNCQTNVSGLTALISGTDAGNTAIGFLPKPSNVQSAINSGLTVSGGNGITHLLSDNYGQNNIAGGVGVRIYNAQGEALNLLTTNYNGDIGENNGWYPVLNNAKSVSVSNGVTTYLTEYMAQFETFNKQDLSAGKYNATLQVVIQVQ